MNEPNEQGRAAVSAAYHQFLIRDDEGSLGPDLPAHHNGLVHLQDGEGYVHTGIHSGDVEVTVTMHRTEPAPDPGPWQEIVEISLNSASGQMEVRNMMTDMEEELPALSFDGPGHYRVRIHARGRDTAVDLTPEQITEWYLIQAWPAPPGPPTVLAAADQYGSGIRARVPDPDATVMGPTRRLSTNPVQRRLEAGETGIPRRLP
ncbi:hypothetical protein [Wenjunlia tyrosinilytica]|uniref:Uncharacterized protein n=1 Tax=Wenjunlia tyrosinilytica TaxID=1544741 RepID=A0A917ZZU6_9ACTN|nr:hypothetical protein [Wenjunlia tyrosinilytica]GGO99117.1 hypothetical protein GCM10012280_64850 [Wenjunlia tyrosinilytica]